jgi:acyl transferase domain-containing protein
MATVYGPDRSRDDPLLIGSVKSNIGHLESASGVVSLIKVALALKRGEIPRSLHFRTPSSGFDWSRGLSVCTAHRAWPARSLTRRAATSAVGISGTYAHVVLESPPDEHPRSEADEERVIPLSARCEESLRAVARAYGSYLQQGGSPHALAYNAACHRTHMPLRAAVRGRFA